MSHRPPFRPRHRSMVHRPSSHPRHQDLTHRRPSLPRHRGLARCRPSRRRHQGIVHHPPSRPRDRGMALPLILDLLAHGIGFWLILDPDLAQPLEPRRNRRGRHRRHPRCGLDFGCVMVRRPPSTRSPCVINNRYNGRDGAASATSGLPPSDHRNTENLRLSYFFISLTPGTE
jgi:hypothetical protein